MIHLLNALFEILLEGLTSIVRTSFTVLVFMIPSRRKQRYESDFGNPDKILGMGNGGFTVGLYSNSVKHSHEHMICFGKTGSGKSTSVVLNSLLSAHRDFSFVILDPSRELFNKLSAHFESIGVEVQLIDLNDARHSSGLNVLPKCTPSDVGKIVNALYRNGSDDTPRDFWLQSAEAVTCLFARYLVTYAEPQYRHFNQVLEMINTFSHNPEALDQLFSTCDKQMLNEYKSLVATPEKTLLSIVSSAKAILSIYADPNVRLITSFDSIDFNTFREGKRKAIFLCTSPRDAAFHKPIMATFFESFFGHILNTPTTTPGHNIMVMLDEAASIRIPSLSVAITQLRKWRVSIGLLLQDESQMSAYGKHESEAIINNCALKIYLPGVGYHTAKSLELAMGKYEFESEHGTRTRELLTSTEIMQIDKAIVCFKNHAPMLVKPTPYYEIRALAKLVGNAPVSIPCLLPFDTPPLLDLN